MMAPEVILYLAPHKQYHFFPVPKGLYLLVPGMELMRKKAKKEKKKTTTSAAAGARSIADLLASKRLVKELRDEKSAVAAGLRKPPTGHGERVCGGQVGRGRMLHASVELCLDLHQACS